MEKEPVQDILQIIQDQIDYIKPSIGGLTSMSEDTFMEGQVAALEYIKAYIELMYV